MSKANPTEIESRLYEFMEHEGILRTNLFESMAGLTRGSARSLTRQTNIENAWKIKQNFPHLNIWWLFLGEGEMLEPMPAMQHSTNAKNNGCINVHSQGGTNNTTGLLVNQTTDPQKFEAIDQKLTSLVELVSKVGLMCSNMELRDKELQKAQKQIEKLEKQLEESHKRCDKLTDMLMQSAR